MTLKLPCKYTVVDKNELPLSSSKLHSQHFATQFASPLKDLLEKAKGESLNGL